MNNLVYLIPAAICLYAVLDRITARQNNRRFRSASCLRYVGFSASLACYAIACLFAVCARFELVGKCMLIGYALQYLCDRSARGPDEVRRRIDDE